MRRVAALRTYSRQDAVVFRKTNERFGGLSNMASGFPLAVNGIEIHTSEALYQACRFPHRPEVQKLIIEQASPMTAKMKSKHYRNDTRADWNKVRVNIMRWCLRVKLAQNWQKFSELLLATGNRPIVEESRKDVFWGAKATPEETLVGMNILGRLQMELREELLSPKAELLKRVEPPPVSQLMLCGEPIGIVEVGGATRTNAELFGERSLFSAEPNETSPPTSGHDQGVSVDQPKRERGEPKTREETIGDGLIPKACKRLAEVDFPIAEVSRHAAREKSIRHGHPSTLHLWWARRPLASCRAVLLALLWPDPCDPLCPDGFKKAARERLPDVQGVIGPGSEDLRKALFRFIADFANWDRAANPLYLDVNRVLVKAAYGEESPLVVDPFAGGGSIPLEALRLGCEAFASDLNPVACLILKVMLEDIPRHGPQLAEQLRCVGAEIKRQAEKELAELYPRDSDGATPIAYLWARTVRCESPNCGAEVPLARSFWLCKKAQRRRALRHRIVRPAGEAPRIEFEVFEPETERDVPVGTVTRAKATCIACGTVLPPDRVRVQLAAQSGGADIVFDAQGRRTGGARMLAVVTLRPGEPGRYYRLTTELDYEAVRKSHERLATILGEWEGNGRKGLCPVPDEPLPPVGTLGFRVQRYGMLQWGDLFTVRQKVALTRLVSLSRAAKAGEGTSECLGLVLDGVIDRNAVLSTWRPQSDQEKVEHVFARQTLSMTWDFAEAVPISESTGSLSDRVAALADTLEKVAPRGMMAGQVTVEDACSWALPIESAGVWFTDPPYYDAVPYADLSDFFFVWLKRALPGHPLLRDPFDAANPLTPKRREAVQDETKRDDGRLKDRAWFEETMARAFAQGRCVLREDGIGCVVFAHKTTEGWEALLSGMIRGGWTITGSWPITTEMATRLRARESAALATSVHLICRRRSNDAGIGDWNEVLHGNRQRNLEGLDDRVANWMERLQAEGVRGADLVFACIGPALEIFSRYTKVETADGREVALAKYLEKVWEVVGRSALAQVLGTADAKARNGAAGAVEEDARLTALFLWTLQSTNGEVAESTDAGEEEEASDEVEDEEGSSRATAKGFTLIFDVVRRFAQPLGIGLSEWEGRVIETKKGVVRLLPIAERAKQLFGEAGAQAVAARLEQEVTTTNPLQGILFPDVRRGGGPTIRGRGRRRGKRADIEATDESLAAVREATTLDRVHAAMLLQAGGRTNALRALLRAEQERSPDFLRLANALSALYPKGSEEKRLVDAMLLAVPR
jgi:putative DNA methylase